MANKYAGTQTEKKIYLRLFQVNHRQEINILTLHQRLRKTDLSR